jgi:hypothetical protein
MSQPQQEPPQPLRNITDSLGSIDILLDGPGDTTRRPRQKNIPGAPPWWEEQFLPENKPGAEKKPDGDQPKAP